MNADLIASIAAAVTSIAAMIITAITVTATRQQIKSDAIAKSRIKWIEDVREVICQFIDVYISDFENQKIREQLYYRVLLFVDGKNKAYVDFMKAMDICVRDTKRCDENIEKLSYTAQNMLQEVWLRAKIESGITKEEDMKMRQEFDNRRKEICDTNKRIERIVKPTD